MSASSAREVEGMGSRKPPARTRTRERETPDLTARDDLRTSAFLRKCTVRTTMACSLTTGKKNKADDAFYRMIPSKARILREAQIDCMMVAGFLPTAMAKRARCESSLEFFMFPPRLSPETDSRRPDDNLLFILTFLLPAQ
jgi:hypothetical protein